MVYLDGSRKSMLSIRLTRPSKKNILGRYLFYLDGLLASGKYLPTWLIGVPREKVYIRACGSLVDYIYFS